MPGKIINQSDPAPLPSRLPNEELQFAVRREDRKLDETARHRFKEFRDAADFIAAAMIFLRDNCLQTKTSR